MRYKYYVIIKYVICYFYGLKIIMNKMKKIIIINN